MANSLPDMGGADGFQAGQIVFQRSRISQRSFSKRRRSNGVEIDVAQFPGVKIASYTKKETRPSPVLLHEVIARKDLSVALHYRITVAGFVHGAGHFYFAQLGHSHFAATLSAFST